MSFKPISYLKLSAC